MPGRRIKRRSAPRHSPRTLRTTLRSSTARASATRQRARRPRCRERRSHRRRPPAMRCALGAEPIELRIGSRDRNAEGLRPATRQGRRAFHRYLLPEHGAHREFESVERPRHAQAREAAHRPSRAADPASRSALTASGAAPRSNRRFTRTITAPMTGASEGDISTSSAMPLFASDTAIQP